MSLRIVTGEKSKACVIVSVSTCLYLVECAFEESGTSVIRGLGAFLAAHGGVLLAKWSLERRGAASDEALTRLRKLVVVSTVLASSCVVGFIYASGTAFDIEWRGDVNGLLIGGLSAICHLLPLERFKHGAVGGNGDAAGVKLPPSAIP